MRSYVSVRCLALAPMCFGWLLLVTSARADAFGVSLSSSGGAGDACQLPAQIDAEGFNSGNLTGSYSLSYSGSAVGYNNGYPNSPTHATATGCVYSPVFANVAASGTAALGVLKAIASADMTAPLTGADASITEGWNDSFKAVSGGTYLLTFSLNAIDNASPACPSSGPLTKVTYSNFISVANYGVEDEADWNYTDCNASTQIPYVYGNTTAILNNNDTVQITLSLSAGETFAISSSLGIGAGAGSGQSSSVNAGDTALLDIVGIGGATYSSASGVTYDYSDSGAPEPATWLLTACALAALGQRVRRRLKAGRRAAA